MKHTSLNQMKGFTLVELLVVVAIIAILSVIGLTVFTSAQNNARDARRKADIDAIANAIEVTRSPGTFYYLSLPRSGFSGSVVPVDNGDAANKPHYCVRTSTTTTAIADPASWTNSITCSTTAGNTNESPWVDIANYGLGAGGTVTATNGTGTLKGANETASKFGTNVISWKVCARLESSSTPYCKNSAQ